jgi:hypothetical protein
MYYWKAIRLSISTEEVIDNDSGIQYITEWGEQAIALFKHALVHVDNTGMLHTFACILPCHPATTPQAQTLAEQYPFVVYLPTDTLIYVHVSQVRASIHLPHACVFGNIGPPDLVRCSIISPTKISHTLLNPYFVWNTYVLPLSCK